MSLERKILYERIDEILERKLLTEEVKLTLFGRIHQAVQDNIITINESRELEKKISFDRKKYKEAVDISLMGQVIDL